MLKFPNRALALALMLAITAPAITAPAFAGPFRRAACRPGVPCPPTTTWSYTAATTTTTTTTTAVTYAGDGPAAFLAALNAERARIGRAPLVWDATLAAFAATNRGIHQPGTNGGAGQCWAGVGSMMGAFHQWMASPPHRAILLGATHAVGVSLCPSGCTANAR